MDTQAGWGGQEARLRRDKTAAPAFEAGCVFEPLPVRCPAPPRGDGDRDQSLEVSRGSAIGWVSQSAATNSGAVARRS